MIDQRHLIERKEWTDIIIFDACRHDVFEEMYRDYFVGELRKAWNGDVGFTYDWFERNFRKKVRCGPLHSRSSSS